MLKKAVLLLSLFFISYSSHSQQITLSGEVYGFAVREINKGEGKLYYTFDNQEFEEDNFITYSSSFNYTWEMSIKKIKERGIKELIFSPDTTVDLSSSYPCVHRVKIGEIVALEQFKKQRSISLDCDIMLDFLCEASVYYGAKDQQLERFIGNYKMTSSDMEVKNVSLKDFAFRYTSRSSVKDENLLHEEYGYWRYDANSSKLTFISWLRRNTYLGLMHREKATYHFEVTETAGQMTFKSDDYELIKLN